MGVTTRRTPGKCVLSCDDVLLVSRGAERALDAGPPPGAS
jgi:hypothetical protein